MFHAMTRLRLRRELIKRGYKRDDVANMIDAAGNDVIDVAAVQSGARGKIGDGTILKIVVDFLNSEGGKKLIDALIKLLLSFI